MTITNDHQYVGHIAKALGEAEDSDATSLDQIAALRKIARLVTSMTTDVVIHARENGASWAEIGAALGVTKQAAQQSYGHHL